MIKYLKAGDGQLLDESRETVEGCLSSGEVQRELIMLVLESLLETAPARGRVEVVLLREQADALMGKLYDRIAAVVSRTYAEMGDAAPLADDEALVLIRKLLLDFDKGVISRNRSRRFGARRKGWSWP
jgi:hypothetical protein